METEGVALPETLASGEGSKTVVVAGRRSEIDTSAPFESVKEAVDRFGGSAVWKSQLKQLLHHGKHHSVEEFELMNVQEQTARMEKDLISKEQETLEVLNELERTDRIVHTLKSRIHEESSELNKFQLHAHMLVVTSPGSIFVELKQAKMNLGMATNNLADVRASIESFRINIEEEKALLKKTLEKLSSKRVDVSSLEDELKHMTQRLQLTKEAKDICNENPADSSMEINHLLLEREQYRQATEAAKSEISRLVPEIEHTKASIKATEIKSLAMKKMEEGSKAAESVAFAPSKALINCSSSTARLLSSSAVVLSIEEYSELTHKVQESDESSRNKIEGAFLEAERANHSKLELIAKIEEASEDLRTRKKILEQALNRVETANTGKQVFEEALRRWRSKHGHSGRLICNSIKLKNPNHFYHKRNSRILDRNGLNLGTEDPTNGLKHTLSIGEIISRKLIGPDDYNIGISDRSNDKATVPLGQIINRRSAVLSQNNGGSVLKQHSRKRKKFVFVGLLHVSMNDGMKGKNTKRKQISGPR